MAGVKKAVVWVAIRAAFHKFHAFVECEFAMVVMEIALKVFH